MRKIYLVPALIGLLTSVAAGPLAAQGAVPKQKAAPAPRAAGAAPAAAGTPVAAGATSAAAAETSAPDDKSKVINSKAIEGFRSAKFGMNEADVRAAIAKDFGAKPDAVRAQDNASELTHSLLYSAPELLPNGGTAELSYVFGYKSKSLIQVGRSGRRPPTRRSRRRSCSPTPTSCAPISSARASSPIPSRSTCPSTAAS